MITIYNHEPSEYSPKAVQILSSVGIYKESACPEEVEAIITRLEWQINKAFLDNYSNLRYILTATTGLSHIDIEECNQRDISIISLRGETEFLSSIAATAEHTIGLMLSLLRNIPEATKDVGQYKWNRMDFKGRELKGKTLCILGLGRLGIQVANIATAFGMTVKAFDQFDSGQYPTTTNLAEALEKSDIVSIHLPYTSQTHHLLTTDLLMRTNPQSYLINTSRGEIINETDLVTCLKNKHLAGVAVDVIEHEYDIHSSPLLKYSMKYPNAVITPHIGGCTYESMEATEIFIAKKFKDIYTNKNTRTSKS